MSNHLFLFTIGPVQSFIAQARKTRDLYAGSQILSTLVAEGMRAFKKEFSTGKVIFPDPAGKDGASLPNRFIGKVSANKSELKAKAAAIQQTVEDKWMEIAEESLQKAGVDPKSPRSEAQLKALLDIHWVFNEIKTNYAEAYEGLERLGGAVKNIRTFHQLTEQGRKCSLDGVNNALYCNSRNSGKWHEWNKPLKIKGFSIGETEALSAVSLTKRFYHSTENFPSTARVALMHDIQNLSSDNQKRLKCFEYLFDKDKVAETCITMFNNRFIEQAKVTNIEPEDDWNTDWDEHFLFEENLNKIEHPDQRRLLGALHKELKKHLKTRYYAIIMFDGDHMGKWLSGEKNLTTDNLEEFHTVLSCALAKFGNEAKEYLDKANGNGHAVYAGGDDFLGFVNIHCLFEVMKHLRKQFNEIVNQGISKYKREGENLTFSAGIVIAHYKMPFSEVLKKAREVEKAAKHEGGRNAFGIAVMKHSGEVQQAVYKWGESISNWEALKKIVAELDNDKGNYSNTFIQNLTAELYQLTGKELGNLETGRDFKPLELAISKEIKRLVSKSLKNGGKEDPNMAGTVAQLWEDVSTVSEHRTRQFIHALHIADFLTRKTKEA